MPGAFDWLTGSTDTVTGSQNNTSNTNTTTIGSNTQSGSQKGTTTTSGTNTTTQNQQQTQNTLQNETDNAQTTQTSSSSAKGRTLSDAEIATLDQAAGSIAGDKSSVLGTASDATDIAKQLVTRASGEGDIYQKLASSATEAAKNTYATQTLADINSRSDKFGSSDSSLDALLHDQGNRNLDVQLAQIADQVGITGQQAQSKDLVDALSGLIAGGGLAAGGTASASSALATLLNTAKGGVSSEDINSVMNTISSGSKAISGTTTTTGTGTTVSTNTQQQLQDLITELTTKQATNQTASTDTTATTNTKTDKSGSPIDILKAFASL